MLAWLQVVPDMYAVAAGSPGSPAAAEAGPDGEGAGSYIDDDPRDSDDEEAGSDRSSEGSDRSSEGSDKGSESETE